jgi:diaminopimelate epimerase
LKLAKAHGLGNDFLLVADRDVPGEFGPWARRLCDRHTGVGADGVLRYRVEGSDVRMWLINADGGLVELSGNGVRCLAAYAVMRGWVPDRHAVLTPAGPRAVRVHALGGAAFRVEADLGIPALRAFEIPSTFEPADAEILDHPLTVGGHALRVTATSMGNPHCAVFVDAPAEDALVAELGPELERHPLFPQRTNVEFVSVTSRSELRVRFWERGVGPTRSSGTGSASAAVAAIRLGLADRGLRVVCDGGTLEMEWPEAGPLRQTGDVEVLFEADWLLAPERTAASHV